ncbi:MAG: peptidyl-tRNA hydrolase [Pirellulaceae bacterium]|jgi:peptidyl-tRNA hydrolase
MRHDLKMRRGKQIAQGAHAAMSFLCRRLQQAAVQLSNFDEAQRAWLTESFAKVCVRVDSEEELLEIYDKALAAQLEVHLITDPATRLPIRYPTANWSITALNVGLGRIAAVDFASSGR